jgi:hypothetical protein
LFPLQDPIQASTLSWYQTLLKPLLLLVLSEYKVPGTCDYLWEKGKKGLAKEERYLGLGRMKANS